MNRKTYSKAFHFIDDAIERVKNPLKKQSGGLYLYSLALLSKTISNDFLMNYVDCYILSIYEKGFVMKEHGQLMTAATAIEINDVSTRVANQIIMDRADNYVNRANTSSIEVVRPINKIINIFRKTVRHYINVEELCYEIMYLVSRFKHSNELEYLSKAESKANLICDYLYVSDIRLIKSFYDTSRAVAMPNNACFLGSSALVCYAFSLLGEALKDKFKDTRIAHHLFEMLNELEKYRCNNGYYPPTESTTSIQYDSYTTLLVVASRFVAIRIGILTQDNLSSTIDSYNRVIDDFQLSNGLLSIANCYEINSTIKTLSKNMLVLNCKKNTLQAIASFIFATRENAIFTGIDKED